MKPKGCAAPNGSHKWKQSYFRTCPLLDDRREFATLLVVALGLTGTVQHPGTITVWSGVCCFLISPLERRLVL